VTNRLTARRCFGQHCVGLTDRCGRGCGVLATEHYAHRPLQHCPIAGSLCNRSLIEGLKNNGNLRTTLTSILPRNDANISITRPPSASLTLPPHCCPTLDYPAAYCHPDRPCERTRHSLVPLPAFNGFTMPQDPRVLSLSPACMAFPCVMVAMSRPIWPPSSRT
jgi:hypothetical protein